MPWPREPNPAGTSIPAALGAAVSLTGCEDWDGVRDGDGDEDEVGVRNGDEDRDGDQDGDGVGDEDGMGTGMGMRMRLKMGTGTRMGIWMGMGTGTGYAHPHHVPGKEIRERLVGTDPCNYFHVPQQSLWLGVGGLALLIAWA